MNSTTSQLLGSSTDSPDDFRNALRNDLAMLNAKLPDCKLCSGFESWTELWHSAGPQTKPSLVHAFALALAQGQQDFVYYDIRQVQEWLAPLSASEHWVRNACGRDPYARLVEQAPVPVRPAFAEEGRTIVAPAGASWTWFLQRKEQWNQAMAPFWEAEARAIEQYLATVDPASVDLTNCTWESALPAHTVGDVSITPVTDVLRLFRVERVSGFPPANVDRFLAGTSRMFLLSRPGAESAPVVLNTGGSWHLWDTYAAHVPPEYDDIVFELEALCTRAERKLAQVRKSRSKDAGLAA